jgi:hypothetical protein
MIAQFELSVWGGASGRRLRRRRQGFDRLPWGTLRDRPASAAALEEARQVWTNGVFTEFASGAAFATLAALACEAGAPIDLVAMAADFAVDEMDHAELAGRLLAELGGACPYEVDLQKVTPLATDGAPAALRAVEIALKTCSVGEALSVPVLTRSMRGADHPLVQAVLGRITRDEAHHPKLGDLLLEWAEPVVRRHADHLRDVALETLLAYAPLWQRPACGSCELAPLYGGIPQDEYRALLRETVVRRVVRPLLRRGIDLRGPRLSAMLRDEDAPSS